jgi:hypothetical protein
MASYRLGDVIAGMMPEIALNTIEHNTVRAATAEDPVKAADARTVVKMAWSFLMALCTASIRAGRDAA